MDNKTTAITIILSICLVWLIYFLFNINATLVFNLQEKQSNNEKVAQEVIESTQIGEVKVKNRSIKVDPILFEANEFIKIDGCDGYECKTIIYSGSDLLENIPNDVIEEHFHRYIKKSRRFRIGEYIFLSQHFNLNESEKIAHDNGRIMYKGIELEYYHMIIVTPEKY